MLEVQTLDSGHNRSGSDSTTTVPSCISCDTEKKESKGKAGIYKAGLILAVCFFDFHSDLDVVCAQTTL